MSASRAVVVDYGMGNVLSVCRALEHCGGNAELSAEPRDVAGAERLVLPGVGAFGDCMNALCERDLVEPIMAFAASGRPLLGICVGMQILLDHGEEFGGSAGLGLIPGSVVKISTRKPDGASRKIPHIGWSAIRPPGSGNDPWKDTLFARTKPNTSFYFVHSFTAAPTDPGHVLAEADYQDFTVTAAVRRDNVTGCQFHPEKSGGAGMHLIKEYLRC